VPVTDPRVDAYIATAKPFAQPILERIRRAVHAGCPEVVETIKWGVPAFEYKGPLCGMAAFKAHCLLGFWKHPLMKTVKRAGAGEFGRIESIDAMPTHAAIVKMVREAVGLNDAGVKVPRVSKPKPPLETPAAMMAAIRKNRKAHQTFAAFSPSCRREYVEWITDAKTDQTRNRRITQAVEWIAEGKRRNWKYER
jgi:uncharacterized protein YdeI (YjbR/CyaY-like superfamily)